MTWTWGVPLVILGVLFVHQLWLGSRMRYLCGREEARERAEDDRIRRVAARKIARTAGQMARESRH